MKTTYVLCLLLLAGYEAQAQCEASQFDLQNPSSSDAFDQACIDAITADPVTSICAAECQGLYNAYLDCFGESVTTTVFSTCGGFQGGTTPPPMETPTTEATTATPNTCDASDFAFNPQDPSGAFDQACIDAITADPVTSFCAAECQGLYNAYLECFGESVTTTFFSTCGGFQGGTTPPPMETPTTEATTATPNTCDASDFAFNPQDPSGAFDQACIDAITADPVTSFCAAECQGLYNAYLECFGESRTTTFFSACGGFQGSTTPPPTEAPTTEATSAPSDTCGPSDFAFNPQNPSGAFDQACIDGITADPSTSFCVTGCQSLYNAYLVCFGATATETFFSTCGGFQGDTDPDIGGNDDDGDAAATTTSNC